MDAPRSVAGLLIDEEARRRFEAAWAGGDPPPLADFLPAPDSPLFPGTLEELVHIDLEMRWRLEQPGPRIESYVERHPPLGAADVLGRLIETECLVRHQYGGAAPTPGEYEARFPGALAGAEARVFDTVADELGVPRGAAIGRYRLLGEHARGGFGRVWRAEDAVLGRTVALKQLSDRLAGEPSVRARFVNEARITARLEHPGIVPVHELGDDAGEPYYTMKLVRGRTLGEVIREHFDAQRGAAGDRLDERRLVDVFLTVARTAAYAHAKRVIHRDLKPENIIVGDYGEVHVLDWGIAKDLSEPAPEPVVGPSAAPAGDAAETRVGEILGTPAYMSPEQASGQSATVDERSDVFALGAILYEMLTGQRPFGGGTPEEVLDQVLTAEPAPPNELRPGVSRPLAAICMRAMAKRREARYAAVSELAADVERYLGGEPVSAYRETLPERALRWARAHRMAVAVASAVLLVCAIAAAVGLFWWQSVEQEREQATAERKARQEIRVAADQASARSELRAGRYEAAMAHLEHAFGALNALPALRSRAPAVAEKLGRVQRLARFSRLADEAWFEAGDNPVSPSGPERAREALGALGLDWNTEPWAAQPFEEELSEQQRARLREDVQRLTLLQGILEATPAMADPFGTDAGPACRRALDALARTEGRGAVVAELLGAFCRMRLGESYALPEVDATQTNHPVDHYFLGFIHFWMRAFPSQQVTIFARMLTSKVRGLDFDAPLQTAIAHFRAAAALEPDRYWHHFMVGWALMVDEDYPGAELAYNACVALRPAYHQAYVARADALIRSAEDERPQGADALRLRARLDLEAAHQLAPYASTVHLLQVVLHLRAGETGDAVDSLLLGLILDEAVVRAAIGVAPIAFDADLSWLGSWSGVVDGQLEGPHARAALAATALANLVTKGASAAEATIALAVGSGDESPELWAVRGAAHLAAERWEPARADFARAHAAAPGLFLAAAGYARTLEVEGATAASIEAWERSAAVALAPWQRRLVEAALDRLREG